MGWVESSGEGTRGKGGEEGPGTPGHPQSCTPTRVEVRARHPLEHRPWGQWPPLTPKTPVPARGVGGVVRSGLPALVWPLWSWVSPWVPPGMDSEHRTSPARPPPPGGFRKPVSRDHLTPPSPVFCMFKAWDSPVLGAGGDPRRQILFEERPLEG